MELPEEESGDGLDDDDDDDGSDSYFADDAGALWITIPISNLYLEKGDDISTRDGRLAFIRRMLRLMKEDDAFGWVSMLDTNLLEGICAAFELNGSSKRLPKRGVLELEIKALSHLVGDKALSLPVSDLQEVDLMTVPESEGAVTVTVHGTTMIPLDLGLYKQLLAEYTGCCIDEVRFFDWC